jgi:cytochrome oxidase Cu insertion factor (SCO1/SenC/PrrC family)
MKFRLVMIVALSFVFVLSGCSSSNEKDGEPAFSFNAKDIQGNSISLKNESPTLMYFMASWCPTCIGGEKVLKEVQELYPKVQLITIDVDPTTDTVESLSEFQKKYGGNWPHVLDDGQKITKGYSVKQLEEMIVVDKNQEVVFRATNPSLDELKEVLTTIGVK